MGQCSSGALRAWGPLMGQPFSPEAGWELQPQGRWLSRVTHLTHSRNWMGQRCSPTSSVPAVGTPLLATGCLQWVSQSRSVVSNSLRPHGLYSPWNSPDQNAGMGSHSLLQGIFPTQGPNPGFPHSRWILYQLSHQGSPGASKVSSILFRFHNLSSFLPLIP